MATKLKNPCEGCKYCERCYNYMQCARYKTYISKCWDMFKRVAMDMKTAEEKKLNESRNTRRYHNPDLVREYLATSPCDSCKIRDNCPDNQSCATYDRWTEDRWKIIKHRLRK